MTHFILIYGPTNDDGTVRRRVGKTTLANQLASTTHGFIWQQHDPINFQRLAGIGTLIIEADTRKEAIARQAQAIHGGLKFTSTQLIEVDASFGQDVDETPEPELADPKSFVNIRTYEDLVGWLESNPEAVASFRAYLRRWPERVLGR